MGFMDQMESFENCTVKFAKFLYLVVVYAMFWYFFIYDIRLILQLEL